MPNKKYLEVLANKAFEIATILDSTPDYEVEIIRPDGIGIWSFNRDVLNISANFDYDGPRQVSVKWGWNNEVFFCDENLGYEDDDSRPYLLFKYFPGIWEREIERWYAISQRIRSWRPDLTLTI